MTRLAGPVVPRAVGCRDGSDDRVRVAERAPRVLTPPGRAARAPEVRLPQASGRPGGRPASRAVGEGAVCPRRAQWCPAPRRWAPRCPRALTPPRAVVPRCAGRARSRRRGRVVPGVSAARARAAGSCVRCAGRTRSRRRGWRAGRGCHRAPSHACAAAGRP
uniref:Uncharacterized protein n=1 Tax=Amycolatopsis mediterranei TaxID=33910 RepID=Q7BUD6_AMYMD|nr:hypothetical protein [Amycolatopsis mediterranei S699]